MTDSQKPELGSHAADLACLRATQESEDSERRGRIAAEERLARIRVAMSGETWSMAISRWRVATFGVGPLERSYERALEEFDEMQAELGLVPDGAQPNKFIGGFGDIDRQKVSKEAADFVISLAAFVADLGFDLATEIAEKHRINSTERTWHSRGDGTGYHVKPLNAAQLKLRELIAKGVQIPVTVVPQCLIDDEKQFVDPKTKNLVVKCEDRFCKLGKTRPHRTDDPQCADRKSVV